MLNQNIHYCETHSTEQHKSNRFDEIGIQIFLQILKSKFGKTNDLFKTQNIFYLRIRN